MVFFSEGNAASSQREPLSSAPGTPAVEEEVQPQQRSDDDSGLLPSFVFLYFVFFLLCSHFLDFDSWEINHSVHPSHQRRRSSQQHTRSFNCFLFMLFVLICFQERKKHLLQHRRPPMMTKVWSIVWLVFCLLYFTFFEFNMYFISELPESPPAIHAIASIRSSNPPPQTSNQQGLCGMFWCVCIMFFKMAWIILPIK